MKKLILSGTLCLAVFAVAKFGYILDYRLSDANPVVVLQVQADQSDESLKVLKKKVDAAKREKTRLWRAYKATKQSEKTRYEDRKKTFFDTYNKAKVKIFSEYKDRKKDAKSDYNTKRKKEWKVYKDWKKFRWDRYQKAKKDYTKKKESYKKCKADKEADCSSQRTAYKVAGKKRKDYKYAYNAEKNPNHPDSRRARYDRLKAKFKSYYEEYCARAKDLRVSDRKKARNAYEGAKVVARKSRTDKIRTARSNYNKVKLVYLKLKQVYERRKAQSG